MLKHGGTGLLSILQDTFNQVLDGKVPPQSWKKTIIMVLHKSGDPKLPQNYRPISIIPILYKLFARLLYKRLSPMLDCQQCPDQAGFRAGYSTVDHLFALSQLHEKSYEYQLNLWIAAVDFRKAFDTIEHSGLWEALANQGVPHAYIELLKRLYCDQTGQIRTDKMSKQFDISRGTKQGDPLSSLLFNAILEHIFRETKQKWQQKKYGIQTGVSDASRLNNLRFADDVLLIGKTQQQVAKMLDDLQTTARRFGLSLHPDKTKILTLSQRRVEEHGLDRFPLAT